MLLVLIQTMSIAKVDILSEKKVLHVHEFKIRASERTPGSLRGVT